MSHETTQQPSPTDSTTPTTETQARNKPVAATWDHIAFDDSASFQALIERHELTAADVTPLLPNPTQFAWVGNLEGVTRLVLATECQPITGEQRTPDDTGWLRRATDPVEAGRVYLAGPRHAAADLYHDLRVTASTIHGSARSLTPIDHDERQGGRA
jgi:hypothetical protein